MVPPGGLKHCAEIGALSVLWDSGRASLEVLCKIKGARGVLDGV